jgi:N-formylglutamate deformylase
LFDGRLWDLNLGTADGTSCDPALRSALMAVLESQHGYTHATDARFKGGYITRAYGRPAEQVHAVQLEMTFRCYMAESPPFAWNDARASAVQPLLERLLDASLGWARA